MCTQVCVYLLCLWTPKMRCDCVHSGWHSITADPQKISAEPPSFWYLKGMACTLNQISKFIQPLASIWPSSWWCVRPFYGGWAAGHSVGPPQHTHTSTALIPDPSQDKSTFPFYPSINSFISYASNICHVMVLDISVPQNEDGLISTLQEVRVRTGGIIRLIHR